MLKIQSTIPACYEEDTMTLQIAIQARDGFVLASDMKTLTTGESAFVKPGSIATYPIYETKTRVNEKHQIAIALAGYSPNDRDEAKELHDDIEKLERIPDDFSLWLQKWGEECIQRHHDAVACSLLVIHPTAKESLHRIVILNLRERPCTANSQLAWTLHLDRTTPVTFWPQLFQCDQKPSLTRAVKIAGLTILMAGWFHPNGVGKLELFRFKDRWTRLGEEEIENIEAKYFAIKDSIESALV
jgi:hypothetical protein